MATTQKTSLPALPAKLAPDLRMYLERVREELMRVRGDQAALTTIINNYGSPNSPLPQDDPNTPPVTPPPLILPCGPPVTPTAPTGVEVTGGFSFFMVAWEYPGYCGHSHTEIFSKVNDGTPGGEELLGSSTGRLYTVAEPGNGVRRCFWVRHVNLLGVAGPYQSAEGLCAETALDPEYLLEVLAGQITETQLFRDLGNRIDLIDLPGTGLLDKNIYLQTESGVLAQRITETSARVDGVNKTTIGPTAPTDPQVGDIWYDTTAPNKVLMKRYEGTDLGWVTVRVDIKTFYRPVKPQNTNPADTDSYTPISPFLNGDLWYDTNDFNRPYYWNGLDWVELLTAFTEARIVELSDARIGYCSVTATGEVTSEKDRTACLAVAGRQWNIGLPWASNVKQVSVSTTPYCVLDGVVNKTAAYDTQSECEAAGGKWYPAAAAVVQQEFQTRQEVDGMLSAQYSVKIDNNGFISGFGLSSTPNKITGLPFSEFMVRADRFSLSSPSVPGVPISSLTFTTTTATLTTATAHGLAVDDQFSIRDVTGDTNWNKSWRVVSRVSDTRITFTIPSTLKTPTLSGATLCKVTIPFIVTTTPTLIYAPAVLELTTTFIAAVTTAGISLSLDGGTNKLACGVLVAPITPEKIAASVNTNQASIASAITSSNGTRVTITAKAGNWLFAYYNNLLPGEGAYNSTIVQTIPAGVYITDAYIAKATINWAQINKATIDWLDVTRQLRANKILAGEVEVGYCIQSSGFVSGASGWRICGGGIAEFQGVVVRGTVYATGGEFKGYLIGGDATSYTAGTGLYAGWVDIAGDNKYRFRLGNPTGARVQWGGASLILVNKDNQPILSLGPNDNFIKLGSASYAPDRFVLSGTNQRITVLDASTVTRILLGRHDTGDYGLTLRDNAGYVALASCGTQGITGSDRDGDPYPQNNEFYIGSAYIKRLKTGNLNSGAVSTLEVQTGAGGAGALPSGESTLLGSSPIAVVADSSGVAVTFTVIVSVTSTTYNWITGQPAETSAMYFQIWRGGALLVSRLVNVPVTGASCYSVTCKDTAVGTNTYTSRIYCNEGDKVYVGANSLTIMALKR